MTFKQWRDQVYASVKRITNDAVEFEDLPDTVDLKTAYADKKKPETVAKSVIREAGGAELLRAYNKATKNKPEKPLPFPEWENEVRQFVSAKGRVSYNTAIVGRREILRKMYEDGTKADKAADALLADAVDVQRTGDPTDATGDEFENQ